METLTDALKIQCSEKVAPEIKSDFKAMIEQLMDHSPSDSTVEAELLIGEAGELLASVHIRSQDVDFKAAKRASPDLAMKAIRHELFRQITHWRNHRTVEAAS